MKFEFHKTDKGRIIILIKNGTQEINLVMSMEEALTFRTGVTQVTSPSKAYDLEQEDDLPVPDSIFCERSDLGLKMISTQSESTVSFRVPSENLLDFFEDIRTSTGRILGQQKSLWEREKPTAPQGHKTLPPVPEPAPAPAPKTASSAKPPASSKRGTGGASVKKASVSKAKPASAKRGKR